MANYIGISGWRYPPWRGLFYPTTLPQRLELSFASRVLNSIEINGTFYSLQKPDSFSQWYKDSPEKFIFSVKAPRFITHFKRLKGIEEPLANFFASGVLNLEDKLGPFLWQFPPNLKYDEKTFRDFFRLLPKTKHAAQKLAKLCNRRMIARSSCKSKTKGFLRHAIEVRHESFLNRNFYELLKKYKISAVIADTAGRWPLIEKVTSDFIYVRLHGDKELYSSGYSGDALTKWASRISNLTVGLKLDAYIYFDNDKKVYAPFDAHKLSKRLELKNLLWKKAGLGTKPVLNQRKLPLSFFYPRQSVQYPP